MSVANRPVHRPLSPHLQVYRPQLTSTLSILHRATGIALSVGVLYLAVWVMCASAGPETYAKFQGFNSSIVGRFVHPASLLGCGLRLRAQGRLSQRLAGRGGFPRGDGDRLDRRSAADLRSDG